MEKTYAMNSKTIFSLLLAGSLVSAQTPAAAETAAHVQSATAVSRVLGDGRIYATGQSMGCMSSIVMMLKEPDLFAGALLVAGKWDPELMGPLAGQNIWIISCEGDLSSNTLQGEAVEKWRGQGASVSEATWDLTASPEALSAEADKMRTEGNHLLFTHLTGGSHRATWAVAYGIEGVQEWLFEQHK